jgi:glutaredoxin
MGSLTLYTTLGCHLCQHAEALLEAAGCEFVASDIAEGPHFIGAVRNAHTGREGQSWAAS